MLKGSLRYDDLKHLKQIDSVEDVVASKARRVPVSSTLQDDVGLGDKS